MEQKEVSLFLGGGENQDDSLISPPGRNSFEQGDYRYGRNVRIGYSSSDNFGGGENIPSTLEIDNYYYWDGASWQSSSAPAGTNTAMGRYIDRDEGAVYWIVKNSNDDHQILKFVKSEQKIYEILKWSGLNIQNRCSVSKINNYLFWVDGVVSTSNPPRMVDVTIIYDTKVILGSNFSEYHISFAKWAPIQPPIVKPNVATNDNNLIQHSQFQFRYRYVYVNGFRSTWSPPSIFVSNEVSTDLAFTAKYNFDIVIPGHIFNYETGGSFDHDSIKFYQVVEFIELAYRESDSSNWKLFQRYTVQTSGNTLFQFSNNGSVVSISSKETNQYFDSVPLLSESCEAIDNRPMLGGNEDEFEVPEFAVENVQVYSSDFNSSWNYNIGGLFSSLSATDQNILAYINEIARFSFKSRGLYKLGIIYEHFAGRTGLVQSPDNWIYQIPESQANRAGVELESNYALGFTIPSSIHPPDWAVGYQIVRTNCLNIDFFIQGVVNEIKFLGIDTSVTPNDYKVTPAEAQQILNDYYNANTNSNNSLVPISQRLSAYYRAEKEVTTLSDASRIYYDIKNWSNSCSANAGATISSPSNDVYYNFEKGDRLRFVGSAGATLQWFDVEIIEFTGNGVIINKPAGLTGILRRQDSPPAVGDIYYAIEVYRPKKVSGIQNFEFFEMGEWYPITDARTPSADFSKRDFSWTNQASVTATTIDTGYPIFSKMPIRFGDIWTINKYFYYDYLNAIQPGISSITKYLQMNPARNNAGGNWEHNTGRPLLGYRYEPKVFKKYGQIRFGLRFLEDSIFTAINTFLDENQYIYPSEYGKIRAMVNTNNAQVETVGNVLLVLGELEAWSIYVNRTTLQSLNASDSVSVSDKVLGSFNTLLGSQGTLNPESVSVAKGRVIWWNNKKGAWVRYSRDGLTEITDKMNNWFNDLALLLTDTYATSEQPLVLTAWDNYYEQWLAFINHSTLPSTFRGYDSYKCNTFSEATLEEGGKRWKAVFDYAPDLFAYLDNQVYSIIGSKIHIHEEGTDYGNIYGTPVPSQIELVANPELRQIKDWRSVKLIASDKWSFESIKGDWKSNGGTIQESRIPLTSLEEKEGIFYAPIKRDLNSPNGGANPVVNGNPMKSHAIRLMIQLDPSIDYLSVFNWLNVGYSISSKELKN